MNDLMKMQLAERAAVAAIEGATEQLGGIGTDALSAALERFRQALDAAAGRLAGALPAMRQMTDRAIETIQGGAAEIAGAFAPPPATAQAAAGAPADEDLVGAAPRDEDPAPAAMMDAQVIGRAGEVITAGRLPGRRTRALPPPARPGPRKGRPDAPSNGKAAAS